MKILSIGNSFSTDAHKWLHKLAKINGIDITTANLFIGGCSLETHWENVRENNAFYDYELNGNEGNCKISIDKALKLDEWDVITFQQASSMSGMPETFEPYLSNLVNTVREAQPKANLFYHQTWAYETDTAHQGFLNYGSSQHEMYNKIKAASEYAAKLINADIIPVGTVIQYLRDNTREFDYKNGGISLCRDGYHLSLDYGRFAAAATWLRTLIGKELAVTGFEDFDKEILKVIISAVNIA